MTTFSNNIFAVLEDDVEDTVPEVKPKVEEKKTPAKSTDKSRSQKNEGRSRPDYPQRGGRQTITPTRGTNEDRPPRDRNVGPRFSRREERPDFIPPPDREERTNQGSRDGREARRGSRGGYRGRGREFDRHSGTGKVDSQKKETVGWGDATNAWEEGDKNVAAEAAVDANEIEPKTDAVAVESYEAEAEPEPEEKVKTLDEYLAEKSQKALNLSLPEVRKANEGSDDSKWKDAVLLEEENDEEVFIPGKEQTFRQKNKNKKEKVYLDIEQRFTERPSNDRRGRGDRGGYGDRSDRGGYSDRRNGDDRSTRGGYRGGRGGGRGGRGPSNGVDVDDVEAFPSLGAK